MSSTAQTSPSALSAAHPANISSNNKKRLSKPIQRRTTTSLRPPRRTTSAEHQSSTTAPTTTTTPTTDTSYSVLVDTVAGICGGMAGKAVEYPADTIKVKLQAQATTGTSFTGPLDCFKQTLKQGGVRGLYAGLPVPLLGSMAEMGVLFTAMGRIKHLTAQDPEHPTLTETCLAGGGAGIFASFVLTPVELIKCRLQTRTYSGGAMECVRTSMKEEGSLVFCKFWWCGGVVVVWLSLLSVNLTFCIDCCCSVSDKGFVGTLLREVPGTAAWFGMYELSLSTLCKKEEEPKAWHVILAGGTGGMGYWGAFYPADTVKTEMQTIGNGGVKSSFMETFRSIYRTRGLKGLYAGLGPTLCRAIPANAAVFYVYDVVSRQMLGKQ
jgi:ornithine carrier protein